MDSGAPSRWKFGLRAVLGGAVAIIAVTALAIFKYASAADVATAVGPAVAAIGALTGAYFGIQTGAAGREEADAARNQAHTMALKFAAVADPDRAMAVIRWSAAEQAGEPVSLPPQSEVPDDEMGGLRGIGL